MSLRVSKKISRAVPIIRTKSSVVQEVIFEKKECIKKRRLSELYKTREGKVIVLGCGVSANNYIYSSDDKIKRCPTIGVKYICEKVDCDYLLLVDDPRKMPKDILDVIKNNNCGEIIALEEEWEIWLKVNHKKDIVYYDLGDENLGNLNSSDNDKLDFYINSPYMAVILAYKLGFRDIGIIGIDFTENHFNSDDGVYSLVKDGYLDKIISKYKELYVTLLRNDCRVYNLSPNSLLESVPKIGFEEFNKI